MFKWFSALPILFNTRGDLLRTISADCATAAKQTWELPALSAIQWAPKETGVLLRCEQQKTICSITGSTRETPAQTVVLGCEPTSNMLLLDDFFPKMVVSPVGGEFQLRLPMGDGLMLLQVIIRDEIEVGAAPAYVAEVVGKEAVNDRRSHPRLSFRSPSAPRVDLIAALSPRLRGHLLDLSDDGFAMVYYGAAKPKLFTPKGDCRVDFDEHFTLRCKVQILQVRSRRKPYLHTMVRCRFMDLAETERDKIHAFIRNCVAHSERLDAA